MNLKEMINAQKELRDKIDEVAKTKGLWTEEIGPIRDGVADVELYLQSSPKIMWVLKEPYDGFKDDGSPSDGDYTLMEDLKKCRDAQLNTMPPTIQRVIYSTYGIFTGYEYDDMGWYYDPEIYKYLFQIAYINLSKMPAYPTSGNMTSKYNIWRDIVLKQIDLFQPNVIIFGGTFQYIKEDLGIEASNRIHTEEDWKLNVYKQKDKLYIDTYHPGVRRSPRTYVNMLVNIINEFKKQINC